MFSDYATKQDKEFENWIIFCKRVLNVRKYASTRTVSVELGKLPILLKTRDWLWTIGCN